MGRDQSDRTGGGPGGAAATNGLSGFSRAQVRNQSDRPDGDRRESVRWAWIYQIVLGSSDQWLGSRDLPIVLVWAGSDGSRSNPIVPGHGPGDQETVDRGEETDLIDGDRRPPYELDDLGRLMRAWRPSWNRSRPLRDGPRSRTELKTEMWRNAGRLRPGLKPGCGLAQSLPVRTFGYL